MAIKLEGIQGRTDLYKVDPTKIVVQDGHNTRINFGDLDGLSESIENEGVKKPISVKKGPNGEILLIDGERRLRATLMAIKRGVEIPWIPATFERPTMSATEQTIEMYLSNTGKPFEPIEEAEAFRRLRDVGGMEPAEIAKRLGLSVGTVNNRLLLVDASPALKQALIDNAITLDLATKIITKSCGDFDVQDKLLKQATSSKEGKASVKNSLNGVTKKFHAPVSQMRQHMSTLGYAHDNVDSLLDELGAIDDPRTQLAIQAGIIKGMQSILGKKAPNPFEMELESAE